MNPFSERKKKQKKETSGKSKVGKKLFYLSLYTVLHLHTVIYSMRQAQNDSVPSCGLCLLCTQGSSQDTLKLDNVIRAGDCRWSNNLIK